MKVFLGNRLIKKDMLTINAGLNYGRFFDAKTQNYEIRLSKSEFVSQIEKEYIAIREEIKKDDSTYNDSSNFQATNYCSLEKLFKFKYEFDEIVRTYLDRTLLQKLFPESPNNKYVINSTELVCVDGEEICITGRVFEVMEQ